MLGRRRVLPRCPIYDLTHIIPENFGGATSVVLSRTKMFSELDRRRIDILTIAADPRFDAKEQALRQSGQLGRRVRLRNLWRELEQADDQTLARMVGPVQPPTSDDKVLIIPTGEPEVHRRNDAGDLLQVNRYRGDGTLLFTDRQDVRSLGTRGGRRLTLYDRTGTPTAQWRGEPAFYRAWLDLVTDHTPSVIISDSPTTGAIVASYRRDHVVLVQVLHNSHLSEPAGPLEGPIVARRREIVRNLDNFDVIAALTQDQRADMLAMSLGVDNIVTVPNPLTGTISSDIRPRDRNRGVMVARLAAQKRVDHAVEAMAGVVDLHPDVTLDIFGEGRDEAAIAALVEELHLTDTVRLRGFNAAARQEFEQASFSVLSSRFEGQPLVVLESIAAGCIPIAYDVRYGPASIITHGVDGFLVPAGDVEALARTIRQVVTMEEGELMAMRQAAVRRAADFTPTPIARRWSEVLEQARAHKRPLRPTAATAQLLGVRGTDTQITLTIGIAEAEETPRWAMLAWAARGTARLYGRVPTQLRSEDGRLWLEAVVPVHRMEVAGSMLLDLFVDVHVAGNAHRLRLAAGQAPLPERAHHTGIYRTIHGNVSARVHPSPPAED